MDFVNLLDETLLVNIPLSKINYVLPLWKILIITEATEINVIVAMLLTSANFAY